MKKKKSLLVVMIKVGSKEGVGCADNDDEGDGETEVLVSSAEVLP